MTNVLKTLGLGLSYLSLATALTLSSNCASTFRSPYSLEQRVERTDGIKNKREKYAVLIGGKTEARHVRNLERAYLTLRYLGFNKDKIFVLDDSKKKSSVYPRYRIANKKNIKKTLRGLSEKVDYNDLFLLYTTDHGEEDKFIVKNKQTGRVRKEEVSSLLLYSGEKLHSFELCSYMKDLHPGVKVLISDQCYSGEFAERIVGKRFANLAPNVPGKPTSGSIWSSPFWEAYFQNKGDLDSNGKVDLLEAFIYAKEHDPLSSHGVYDSRTGKLIFHKPILKSDLDPSKIFLN